MKIGINGFGRIGRTIFRLLKNHKVTVINDLTDTKNLAYLLKYDSIYGTLKDKIGFKDNNMFVNGKGITCFNEKDIDKVNWNCDLVIDSSGIERNVKLAKKINMPVIITHGSEDIDTIVIGVNEGTYDKKQKVISASTCTGNCVAPVLKLIDDNYKIKKGFITTIHPLLSYQRSFDFPYKSFPLGRASSSTVLTNTRVVKSIEEVIPRLKNKLSAISYRVNSEIVLSIELILDLENNVAVKNINDMFKNLSSNIIHYADEPLGNLVSVDYRGSKYSAIFDSFGTKVLGGNLLRLILWQDNEIGYASRVLDLVNIIGKKYRFRT